MNRGVLIVMLLLTAVGCQDYEYAFEPDQDRQGTYLRFNVETPSKADILFVIDNSGTMKQEQAALKASLQHMLNLLAPQDTSYRIGIVSTDSRGNDTDCCGQSLPSASVVDGVRPRGNVGNCTATAADNTLCTADARTGCTTNSDCKEDLVNGFESGECHLLTSTDPTSGQCIPGSPIKIRRPHDGALGRLIAAFDPTIFKFDAKDSQGQPLYNIDASLQSKLEAAFPTDVQGVPWVIDRETVRKQACTACNYDATCTPDDNPTLFQTCVKPIAQALVTAYFTSNVNGLGTGGSGYEEGIGAALKAIGINPAPLRPDEDLNPGSGLTAVGAPNRFNAASWVRDEALLAIMFVSDEEDCTMSDDLWAIRAQGEWPTWPTSSMCYNSTGRKDLLQKTRVMAESVIKLKNSASRVAIGFIGGARQSGPSQLERRFGTKADCAATVTITESEQPSNVCSGLTDNSSWESFTQDTSGNSPTCDAMAGGRYIDFANEFRRKTFDSVCRKCPASGSCVAFGPALTDFARLATLACFDLSVRPAKCQASDPSNCDPTLITVKRVAKDDFDAGVAASPLPMLDRDLVTPPAGGGWYYDAADNQVCLIGLDRLLGDYYEIFVLHTDNLDFGR